MADISNAPEAGAEDWCASLEEYHTLLGTVAYLNSGQPPRLTELLSETGRNTNTRHRAIVTVDRSVMIYLSHNMTNWAAGKWRPIARFFPPEVGAHLLASIYVATPLSPPWSTSPAARHPGSPSFHPPPVVTRLPAIA